MLLTPNIAAQLAQHEGLVREAYLDVGDVWTWGIGVTAASGYDVDQYRGAPASFETCLRVFSDLLSQTYMPPVLKAFQGYDLAEHELGAALSFHYNTGAIESARWVPLAKASKTQDARLAIMEWNKPQQIIPRRMQERDLFFEGTWSHCYEVPVLGIDTDCRPDPATLCRVNMRAEFEQLFGRP